MSLGNEQVISGPYSVTFGGVATGIFVGDAGVPTLEMTVHGEPINRTDYWGRSLINNIFMGIDWRFLATLQEYRVGSIATFTPFAALGQLGVVGRLYYDLASALVLTAVTGTPAATAGAPNTLTASKAVLAPEFPIKLLFGPQARTVPIALQLLPYVITTNVYGHFSTT